MLFNAWNIKSESPMFAKRFAIAGDGDSTTLSVALDASPVGMEFRNNKKPTYAFLRQAAGPELYLSIADGVLTFRFERPPAKGERVDIDIEFFYEGL